MEIDQELQEFLDYTKLKYKVLPLEITYEINDFLESYWQGSMAKINWEQIQEEVADIQFPNVMDNYIIQELTQRFNFELFKQDQIVIYVSASYCCISLDCYDFLSHLFHFMEILAVKDLAILLDSDEVLRHQITNNFIELRIFDCITGRVSL